MSVFRPPGCVTYRYDFWLKGRRHIGSTGLTRKEDANRWEANKKEQLRRRSAGLEAADPSETPSFSEWAEVTVDHQTEKKKLKRPDAAENTMRMVLAFWGAAPTETPRVEGGEYRDLKLGDAVAQPELIGEFEEWMTKRKLSGARKNQYRSACSMLFRVAMLAQNRRVTGIRENPFLFLERDRVRRRTAVMTPQQVATWVRAAPPAVAIAVSLNLLTPALRLRNVVELRRDQLTPDLKFLTVPHKTDRETGQPLTVAISADLRRVLKATFKQWPKDPYVVPLGPRLRPPVRWAKGKKRMTADISFRYWRLYNDVRKTLEAAKLPYGRDLEGGITFHSLRHAANTWLAAWGVSTPERKKLGGHTTTAMADWYEHLSGAATVRGSELLGNRLKLSKKVLARMR